MPMIPSNLQIASNGAYTSFIGPTRNDTTEDKSLTLAAKMRITRLWVNVESYDVTTPVLTLRKNGEDTGAVISVTATGLLHTDCDILIEEGDEITIKYTCTSSGARVIRFDGGGIFYECH